MKKTSFAASGKHLGISLRMISAALLAASVLLIVFSLAAYRQSDTHAQSLYELEQERQICEQAIRQLMDGSDYLTSQVQLFVVRGDRRFMDNYWKEVYITKSRDAALDILLSVRLTDAERLAAEESKRGSDELIRREIWAMRMMAESIGLDETEMPSDVAAFRLPRVEAVLTDAEKKAAAAQYIFGADYSLEKDAIRANVSTFRNEIANRYAEQTLDALADTKTTTRYLFGTLLAIFVILAFAVMIFVRQVMFPLLSFSRALSGGDGRGVRLSERGAREIRAFARTFNGMSAQAERNTRRLERMGYVDFLTDVPNRAGITEYVTDAIARGAHPLGVMMIDIDNFKRVNDTYGHAVGDRTLRQVARAVASARPEGDGIAGRLCGEEFVLALPDADEALLRRVAEAILMNARAISPRDVELSPDTDFRITVSVGAMIWRGDLPADFHLLLSRADHALYVSKRTGKDRYALFEEAGGEAGGDAGGLSAPQTP